MTVAELIDELKKFPSDAQVVSRYGEDSDLGEISQPKLIKIHDGGILSLCSEEPQCGLCRPSVKHRYPRFDAIEI